MAKKELCQITLRSKSNGYELTVDDKSYFYFNAIAMLEGIFVHVGLEIERFMDHETILSLITACATYPKEGDAMREAARLQGIVDNQQDTIGRLNSAIARQQAEKQKMRDEINELRVKLTAANAKIDRLSPKPDKPKPESKNPTKVDVGEADKPKKVTSRHIKAKGKAEMETAQKQVPYSDAVYEALMMPLTDTGLEPRIVNRLALLGGSCKTVGDAVRHTASELLKIRGVGAYVKDTWFAWLKAHGLVMGMDVESILWCHAKLKKQ